MRVAIGVLVLSLFSLDASADTLTATRLQDLRETSHRVDVSLRNGVATYVVRRTFHNRGSKAEEARLDISLPHGAVATGLRIKAAKRWYTGELMHARKAEQLYRELTGLGPSRPKDPALLYWQWTGRLGLRVFPIFPGKKSTVEYTLTVPADYSDGAYHVSYGRKPADPKLATPIVRVRGAGIRRVALGDKRANRYWIPLRPVKLHPVLKKLGMSDPRVLVRTINMPKVTATTVGSVKVNIAHSWRGDVELILVDPSNQQHKLQAFDLGDEANDLRKTYTFKYTGSSKGAWHLLAKDHHPLDAGTLKSWTLRVGSAARSDRRPRPIPQPQAGNSDTATLTLTPIKPSSTRVRLGRVDLVAGKHFVNLEVDVAKRLSKLPRALSVVFVVDASRTMGGEGISAQLRLAKAYLSHIPRARFALVGYGHRAESWTSGFVAATAFDATVKRLRAAKRLAPRNGSFLDRGIDMARGLLATQSSRRQHAIIAMTDNRLRPVWKNYLATKTVKQLSAGAIVHIVDIQAGAKKLSLVRNDNHRLFALAKLRGGVAITATGAGTSRWQPLVQKALYLLRPTRLDNVVLPQLAKHNVLTSGGMLAEGSSIRWVKQVKSAPFAVTLRGELWSKKVQFRSRTNEPFNRATAGYVFSHDLFDDLTDAEQYVIASYGKAVSPVTSYLAIEPGVRPSTIGLTDTTGSGSLGSGRFGLSGRSGRGSSIFDWSPIIARIGRACGKATGGSVVVAVSTQDTEIADVVVAGKHTGLSKCVAGQLWATQLPSSHFAGNGDRTFTLNFKGN